MTATLSKVCVPNLQKHHAESRVVVFDKLLDVYIYRRANKSTINIFLKDIWSALTKSHSKICHLSADVYLRIIHIMTSLLDSLNKR